MDMFNSLRYNKDDARKKGHIQRMFPWPNYAED